MPKAAEVGARFGSVTRVFDLVKRVASIEEWDAIERRSTEDLLVDLALGRSRRRPPISALPTGLRRGIRASSGSDSTGCRRAGQGPRARLWHALGVPGQTPGRSGPRSSAARGMGGAPVGIRQSGPAGPGRGGGRRGTGRPGL